MRKSAFRHCITVILAIAVLLITGTASAEKTILVTFTGDVTLGGLDSEQNSPESFDSYAKEKGYDYFFSNFTEMFSQDDLTVINLEGPLTDSKANKANKSHVFRGKTDYVKILTQSGVDAASLSNNHMADYGKQGDQNTKKTLDENGIHWFQDFTYYLYEKDGARIAFFALQNSVIYTKKQQFLNAISHAREEDKAGMIIVCWHTGTEYRATHDPDTEKRVTSLIEEAGVDLIIINHPHVAQGMSIINNRSVFYALGNFVFGGGRSIRTGKVPKDPLSISLYGMVVQAKLTFSDEGRYLGQQITVYPVFSSSAEPDYQPEGELKKKLLFTNDYHPMRLTLKQAEAVYQCIQRDTAFEIPAMTEKDGLAEIDFPYLPAFDGVMIPEDESTGPMGIPEAANPKPTREDKATTGN